MQRGGGGISGGGRSVGRAALNAAALADVSRAPASASGSRELGAVHKASGAAGGHVPEPTPTADRRPDETRARGTGRHGYIGDGRKDRDGRQRPRVYTKQPWTDGSRHSCRSSVVRRLPADTSTCPQPRPMEHRSGSGHSTARVTVNSEIHCQPARDLHRTRIEPSRMHTKRTA